MFFFISSHFSKFFFAVHCAHSQCVFCNIFFFHCYRGESARLLGFTTHAFFWNFSFIVLELPRSRCVFTMWLHFSSSLGTRSSSSIMIIVYFNSHNIWICYCYFFIHFSVCVCVCAFFSFWFVRLCFVDEVFIILLWPLSYHLFIWLLPFRCIIFGYFTNSAYNYASAVPITRNIQNSDTKSKRTRQKCNWTWFSVWKEREKEVNGKQSGIKHARDPHKTKTKPSLNYLAKSHRPNKN